MAVNFAGLRVTFFETRRAEEMAGLIRQWGGRPRTAPSMRELPPLQGPGALPEDVTPLREAIQAVADGQTDVVAFTSARRVHNVLAVAGSLGLEPALRAAMKGIVIGSVGPTCSEALREAGLGVDFEPDRVTTGDLIRGLARSAGMLLERKRASLRAGLDTTTAKRVDLVWPGDEGPAVRDRLHDCAFLRACRREPTEYTPIWLMRQAGRYQRAYRELRSKASFLNLCKTPELAAEVTLMAVEQLGVDAAIIFSDILLVLEPMGVGLSFAEGRGPRIQRPVRSGKDVEALPHLDPQAWGYVYDAVRMARRALRPDIPLIGFCGAPFTVASYLVEGRGGGDHHCRHTKTLMYRDPGAWQALMDRLTPALAGYLNCQIDAGAQAVQLFDTWVGCLCETDYRRFVLPHVKALVSRVRTGTPIIYFGADTAVLLPAMSEAGEHVIGLDWRVNLADAWAQVGHDVAVQGNLDPAVLLATPSEISRRAHTILDQAAGRPGHIFNLGHGILPETPVDHAQALVDAVHEYRMT